MIVAAHQPNYLPWLGFLDKLSRCDLFLVVDHCQFERQGFQNRARIPRDEGWRWLTVPVVQRGRGERILDKRIANDRDGKLRWGRKHFLTLEQVYRGAPYFHHYAPALREILEQPWERLVDLNVALLRFLMKAFELRTPLLRSSELRLPDAAKSSLVLELCKAVGASVYLSGSGASRSYLEVPAFERAGIEVRWQRFRQPEYPRETPLPAEGLSALDLLFHCGPTSRLVLSGDAAELLAGGVDAPLHRVHWASNTQFLP